MRGATRIYHFFVFGTGSVVVGHINARNKNEQTQNIHASGARRATQMYQMLRIVRFL